MPSVQNWGDSRKGFRLFNWFCFNRLIIADELDYLITKDRAVLHHLFMLSYNLPFLSMYIDRYCS